MYLMDISALITPIHSAAMLKNTVFVYQDKKQNTRYCFKILYNSFFPSSPPLMTFQYSEWIVHPKSFFFCVCLQGQTLQIQYGGLPSWVLFSIRSKLIKWTKLVTYYCTPSVLAFLSVN